MFEKFKKKETKKEVAVATSSSDLYVENDVWSIGPFPPEDKKKLWIDSSTKSGGLKVCISREWIAVTVHNPDKHCLDVYDYVDIMSRTED